MKEAGIKALRFGLLLVLVFSAGSVRAEEAALPKEAKAAAEKALSWNSYKTDFALDTKEEDGAVFLLRGTLVYRKPGQRRLQIREGEAAQDTQTLVSDGKVEWQYIPKSNVVYRIDNPPEAPGPHRPFTDVKPETVRFVKKVESPEGALLRFEAEPRPQLVDGSPVPVKTVRLDLSEKDGMLREMVMLDALGEPVLTQRFTGLEVDVQVPDDRFQFTAPEGVSVTQLSGTQPQNKGEN